MPTLDTVGDYVTQVRVLLQDAIGPGRFATAVIVNHLNMALLEIRRVRPDLMQDYFGDDVPSFDPTDLTPSVPLDQMYRMTVVHYITGMTQLIDDEVNDDQRATLFMSKFVGQLTSAAS